MSEKVLHKSLPKLRFRFLLLVTVASVFLAACYPVTRSYGVVKDGQGQPIADATVTIGGKSVKPEEQKTKPDGMYNFGDIEIISHQDPIEIYLTVQKKRIL